MPLIQVLTIGNETYLSLSTLTLGNALEIPLTFTIVL